VDLAEARAVVEATLYGGIPKLPPLLDKQMRFLLKELYRCKSHIVDKRKKAKTLKASFAEKSLEWAEGGIDTAIENVRDAIPKKGKTMTMSSIRNMMVGRQVR
jgi:hypothetical protein